MIEDCSEASYEYFFERRSLNARALLRYARIALWVTSYLLIMASSSACSCPSASSSKQRLPESLVELLDVAIFSFGCQSGLRSSHRVRGDPVLEGVSAFFGRLVNCSNEETRADFERISSSRLGSWAPGTPPSGQLLSLISSRLKTLKSKNEIRRDCNPKVPKLLVHKKQKLQDGTDYLKTWCFPKCWRCGKRCDFCLNKKKNFPNFGDFRVE